MEPWVEKLVTILLAVLASSGFWAFIQNKADKKDARTKLLVGLAHDRILYLAGCYIERGYITQDEYENLYEYLWKPYRDAGGNGSAARAMKEVEKLPIRNHPIKEE